MFNTLLESRARRTRRTGGTVVSITAHALLIGALVAATANATVARDDGRRETPVTFTELPPKPPVEPPPSAPRVYTNTPPALGAASALPELMPPIDIPNTLPPIDLSRPPTNADDFARGTRAPGSPSGVSGNGNAVADGDYYFVGQVEKPVIAVPGSQGPAFPEMLRTAGIEGGVFAQFVVDTAGRADLSTFSVLRTDHALFTASVKAALSRMRFLPAEVGGRKVPQLVQQAFQFNLNR